MVDVRLAVPAVAAVALTVAGCGARAVPLDDDYAGGSAESSSAGSSSSSSGSSSSSSSSSSGSSSSSSADTGRYRDGTYSTRGEYGPIREDSIDVRLTLKDGTVESVKVTGNPDNAISKKHQKAFASSISSVVVGRPLKGLSIDTVAGASWTSEAFNKALELTREQASVS
ncbi:FMN-binding domain protein [Bifidobacterium minimum]|uniref:FMN-binding domain protein n=1 Tax=Bifidobacterium minimum TaxID=1693 RepID=A0A087BSR7_9BIFI|nr:FMN-binding protein [Bifidobacterium minimum]KFI74067.1 FMN-binding domain protein [Bifidobacterium minimum]